MTLRHHTSLLKKKQNSLKTQKYTWIRTLDDTILTKEAL